MTPKLLRFLSVLIIFLLSSTLLSSLYIFLPESYHSLDNRLRDFFFVYRGEIEHSEDIVIVDIDEKSLKVLGQWPWERKHMATILNTLTQAEAGIIGLDIIFSEPDKTSPKYIFENLGIEENKIEELISSLTLPAHINEDYDLSLAQSVASTPTILGYLFDFEGNKSVEAPNVPAIFIEKGFQNEEFLFNPQGTLLNIDLIQEQGYSSGYLNNVPDESGMVRSVPLLMKFDDSIYPSLAFEMIRIALSASKVSLQYDETGIKSFHLGETSIPTDRYGRLYVNFKGPSRTFTYISAIDIINQDFYLEDIQGKIILIGTSAYGLMDLRATPLDSIMPGVEIHANVIDNILNQEMLYRPDWVEGADLLLIIFLTGFIILVLSYLPFWVSTAIMTSLSSALLYTYYILLFQEHIVLSISFPILSIIFSSLLMLIIKFVFEHSQKELIKGKFSQKVSPAVMEDLIKQEDGDYLHVRNEIVTIYFSDIRSFTSISEQLHSPKLLVEFLNYYMTKMVNYVVKRKGTVDKFIGDAVMAYWNAPSKVENHADEAVLTSLEQLEQRASLSAYTQKKYGFTLDFGIGINTGEVTIGDIGSKGRSDYTIIGDSVNLASRLEGLCKYYGVRLIISQYTKELLIQEYHIKELDWVKVKGKSEPVKIYEVLSLKTKEEELAETENYHQALLLYRNKEFISALKLFEELYAQNESKLNALYVQRCKYLIENRISDFDGTFEFDFK